MLLAGASVRLGLIPKHKDKNRRRRLFRFSGETRMLGVHACMSGVNVVSVLGMITQPSCMVLIGQCQPSLMNTSLIG